MVYRPPPNANDDVAFPANVSASWPGTLPELAASIAHEMNRPLAVPLAVIVAGGGACLQWLADDDLELDEARATIAAMIDGALRTSGIVRGPCALATGAEPRKARLDLNEIVEQAIALIAEEVCRNKVLLKLELASRPLVIAGDQSQLQQLVVNLALNGIQAMASVHDRTRRLRVQSRRCGNVASVVIQDTGVGFAAHDIERLFEGFRTTKPGGMGVGLPLCRSIVEAHGGAIWAASNVGHGAAFCFTLPLLDEEAFRCRPATPRLTSACRRCKAFPPAKEIDHD